MGKARPSMLACTPCPSFVGCFRATTAPNGSPRGTPRRPAQTGLLERHAMDRPRRETRIRVDCGDGCGPHAAGCVYMVRRTGQEPCGYRQQLFRQYDFRLVARLRQLAVGTPGVPRGELDGGPTGAPLTRPSAAGVRCRQTRSARRPRRNSTYRHGRADWMGARSPPHKSCAAAGVPRGERGLRRGGDPMDVRLVPRVCVPRFRYGRMPLFIRFPAGNFRSHSATPVGDGCTRRRLARDRAYAFLP